MYQKHSEASKEAYEFNQKNNSTAQREDVHNFIKNRSVYGVTGGEIALALGMQTGTVSARLIELHEQGYILKTSLKRKNASGCSANIYVNASERESVKETGCEFLAPMRKKPNKTVEDKNKALMSILRDVNNQLERNEALYKGDLLHSQIKTILNA